MSCDVLEKTDLDADLFNMDFTNKLPPDVLLVNTLSDDPPVTPTVTWLYADGSSVAAADRPATANFSLSPSMKSWQFSITGGTLGRMYMVRVVVKKTDGRDIEGNGILRIRIPCLA